MLHWMDWMLDPVMEHMLGQKGLMSDTLTVPRCTAGGRKYLRTVRRMWMELLVVRQVNAAFRGRVDELLWRHIVATERRAPQWAFSAPLFLAEVYGRDHAQLTAPHLIKESTPCTLWHPCFHRHPKHVLRFIAALWVEAPWVRYFLARDVRTASKGEVVTTYHTDAVRSLSNVVRPYASSMLSIGGACRVCLLCAAGGLQEPSRQLVASANLFTGCTVMIAYCDLGKVQAQSDLRLNIEFNVVLGLVPVATKGILGWIQLVTTSQSIRTYVAVFSCTCMSLFLTVTPALKRVRTNGGYGVLIPWDLISHLDYRYALLTWMLPAIWIDMPWRVIGGLLLWGSNIGCALLMAHLHHNDLIRKPHHDRNLRWRMACWVVLSMTALCYLVVNTAHECFVELPWYVEMTRNLHDVMSVVAVTALGLMTFTKLCQSSVESHEWGITTDT